MLVENINTYAREMKNFKFFKSIIKPLKEVCLVMIPGYGIGGENRVYCCIWSWKHE